MFGSILCLNYKNYKLDTKNVPLYQFLKHAKFFNDMKTLRVSTPRPILTFNF